MPAELRDSFARLSPARRTRAGSWRHAVAFALAAGAVACDSSSETGGYGTGPATTMEAFAGQYCESFGKCCSRPFIDLCVGTYGDVYGDQTYDQARGNECLTALRAAGSAVCADDYLQPPVCRTVLTEHGTAAPGESCSMSNGCAPSAEGDVVCARAKCQIQVLGKVGDTPCVGTFNGSWVDEGGADVDLTKAFVCDALSGAYCDATSTCRARGAAGAPCTGTMSFECASDTYCDAVTKQCAARRALGANCSDHRQCAGAAYCDGASSTCMARKSAGSACVGSFECNSGECLFSTKKCGRAGVVAFLCGD